MRKYPRKTTQSLANRCKALCVPLLSHHASSHAEQSPSNAKLSSSKNSLIFIMLKLFISYVSVGSLNTAINRLCLGALFRLIGFSQAISKLIVSCVAVTLSFSSTPNAHLSPKQQLAGTWTLSLKKTRLMISLLETSIPIMVTDHKVMTY